MKVGLVVVATIGGSNNNGSDGSCDFCRRLLTLVLFAPWVLCMSVCDSRSPPVSFTVDFVKPGENCRCCFLVLRWQRSEVVLAVCPARRSGRATAGRRQRAPGRWVAVCAISQGAVTVLVLERAHGVAAAQRQRCGNEIVIMEARRRLRRRQGATQFSIIAIKIITIVNDNGRRTARLHREIVKHGEATSRCTSTLHR